jgi:hypothetical protein
MRAELLERLEWLFPDKKWPKRVAAKDLAAFTVSELSESAIHKRAKADRPGAFRALHLAETISRRTQTNA